MQTKINPLYLEEGCNLIRMEAQKRKKNYLALLEFVKTINYLIKIKSTDVFYNILSNFTELKAGERISEKFEKKASEVQYYIK